MQYTVKKLLNVASRWLANLLATQFPQTPHSTDPFLTTSPDPDEIPITPPLSQQEYLYRLNPPYSANQKTRVSNPRLSPPTTGMKHGATSGLSSNTHHPTRLDALNEESPSRPSSFANVRAFLWRRVVHSHSTQC
jgi:hypothetical protein